MSMKGDPEGSKGNTQIECVCVCVCLEHQQPPTQSCFVSWDGESGKELPEVDPVAGIPDASD